MQKIPSCNEKVEFPKIPSTNEQVFELLVGIRYNKLSKIPSNIVKDAESANKANKVEMPKVTSTSDQGSEPTDETRNNDDPKL